jgi:hypothetical protein
MSTILHTHILSFFFRYKTLNKTKFINVLFPGFSENLPMGNFQIARCNEKFGHTLQVTKGTHQIQKSVSLLKFLRTWESNYGTSLLSTLPIAVQKLWVNTKKSITKQLSSLNNLYSPCVFNMQIVDGYCEAVSKMYYQYFKNYLASISKLQVHSHFYMQKDFHSIPFFWDCSNETSTRLFFF